MRGSVVLACALLACRARAGSREAREDLGSAAVDVPVVVDAPRVDVEAAPPTPWTIHATQGARLRRIVGGCRPAPTTSRTLTLSPGDAAELVGSSGEDARVSMVWDAPADFGVEAFEGFTRVAPAVEPGVSLVLAWGFVTVNAAPGRAVPVRVDTPSGRLVVTQGRAHLTVTDVGRRGAPGVVVQTRGAEARWWTVRDGRASAERLPAQGLRRWTSPARDAETLADDALRAAEGMPDAGDPDARQAAASILLGEATAARLQVREGDRGDCEGFWRRRDAQLRSLLALAR
ncbi:MAG: hypothetical protein U0325_15385 [Polyangiales bacterium]